MQDATNPVPTVEALGQYIDAAKALGLTDAEMVEDLADLLGLEG